MVEESEQTKKVLLIEESATKMVRNEQPKMGRIEAEDAEETTNLAEPMEIEERDGKKLGIPSLEKKVDWGKPIIVETLDTRGKPEITGLENMEEVMLNPAYPQKTFKVGKDISVEERKEIIELLRDSLDFFAWVVEDMQGVDREVAEHQLNVDPRFIPI